MASWLHNFEGNSDTNSEPPEKRNEKLNKLYVINWKLLIITFVFGHWSISEGNKTAVARKLWLCKEWRWFFSVISNSSHWFLYFLLFFFVWLVKTDVYVIFCKQRLVWCRRHGKKIVQVRIKVTFLFGVFFAPKRTRQRESEREGARMTCIQTDGMSASRIKIIN